MAKAVYQHAQVVFIVGKPWKVYSLFKINNFYSKGTGSTYSVSIIEVKEVHADYLVSGIDKFQSAVETCQKNY